METASAERRRYPRLRDEHTIALKYASEEGTKRSHMFFHLTQDISRGGLRFRNRNFIPVNTDFTIHIALKDPLKTLTQTGVVRWVKRSSDSEPFSVGVEFTTPTGTSLQAWEDYVDQRQKCLV